MPPKLHQFDFNNCIPDWRLLECLWQYLPYLPMPHVQILGHQLIRPVVYNMGASEEKKHLQMTFEVQVFVNLSSGFRFLPPSQHVSLYGPDLQPSKPTSPNRHTPWSDATACGKRCGMGIGVRKILEVFPSSVFKPCFLNVHPKNLGETI